jgi:hypothetical protein
MAEYQLTANEHTILRVADNAHIPDDPANRDYQEYLAWLDDGNIPDPAPLPPEPPEPTPVDLPPVMPTDPNHAAPKGYVDAEILKSKAEVVPLTERMEAIEARMIAVERQLK